MIIFYLDFYRSLSGIFHDFPLVLLWLTDLNHVYTLLPIGGVEKLKPQLPDSLAVRYWIRFSQLDAHSETWKVEIGQITTFPSPWVLFWETGKAIDLQGFSAAEFQHWSPACPMLRSIRSSVVVADSSASICLPDPWISVVGSPGPLFWSPGETAMTGSLEGAIGSWPLDSFSGGLRVGPPVGHFLLSCPNSWWPKLHQFFQLFQQFCKHLTLYGNYLQHT